MSDKQEYSIGDVSKLLSVQQHTIRFWEKEFPFLNPEKNGKGRRVYTLADIRLLQQIKKLLYEDQYSIKGALQVLEKDLGNPVKISTETLSKRSIDEKEKLLKTANPQSVLHKGEAGDPLYKKIREEILLKVYQTLDDLMALWQELPDDPHR